MLFALGHTLSLHLCYTKTLFFSSKSTPVLFPTTSPGFTSSTLWFNCPSTDHSCTSCSRTASCKRNSSAAHFRGSFGVKLSRCLRREKAKARAFENDRSIDRFGGRAFSRWDGREINRPKPIIWSSPPAPPKASSSNANQQQRSSPTTAQDNLAGRRLN